MKYDYIIVGQGIAGSMIAWFLLKQNKSFIIYDKLNSTSSSNIAAGVINPVTGRKMVKTWMIDAILPFAKNTYQEIEQSIQTSFFFEKNIYKIFTSEEDIEIWNQRKNNVAYQDYLGDCVDLEEKHILSPFKTGIIKNTYWMDMPVFIHAFRNYLSKFVSIVDEQLDYSQLKIQSEIHYQNITADRIIFCEGYRAKDNPFFENLPFTFAKGEQLLIKTKEEITDKLLNRNIILIPKGNNFYSVGATYVWNDLSEIMTNEGRSELTEKLNKMMVCPYEIVEEKAAIRPTTKDRRPFIDRHKTYENVFIFNGMGTKGISLSPFMASYFINSIETNSALMNEISISRF
ncbi:MAG: FAD-binding oxidoreductase [Chitinophagales bacterium]|nr:FAD-binding oxidoreductase [Chitinophagales bacterium]